MRPSAPLGFVSDCSLSTDHPGRLVPPRVYLETVETAARERGGLSSHFTPRLLVTQNITKEVKSFLAFSAEMSKKNEKLIQAGAFVHALEGNSATENSYESLQRAAHSLVPNQDTVTKNLSNFGYFEETPLVVINPLTTAEIKKFGNALSSSDTASKTIQSQRSDFAKLLEESLSGGNNNNNNNHKKNNNSNSHNNNDQTVVDTSLLPSFPEASQFSVGAESELRRKAAEAFVERCKQLWEMFRSMQNDGTSKTANDDPQIQKMMAANKNFATGRFQLLKQPLVYSLQVATCAQDIACNPYVGYSWDLLGGSTKDWQQKRITLADVFASEDEARKQIEVAVLVHKILVAICKPVKIDVRVEPSDLAVLSYFALPRTDGGDGNRLFELWPSGPLALFPIASFASFVPIKEASNAEIDLVAESRTEDGDEPLLRIRCFTDIHAVQQQQQHQLSVQQEASGAIVGSGLVPTLHQELRIWKKPISSTVPDDVKAAQQQAKMKDPRLAVAKFMQGLKDKAMKGDAGREEAVKMALQLAETTAKDKK